MTDLVLGIDTGGTYTDGVLLDYDTREVVASTKTLTTRHDLSVGILNALDALLPGDHGRVKLVSISTTLATNAVAEGKGRPVALFLLGYDPDLVRRFKFESNFAASHFEYIRGGHDLLGQEQEPLDEDSLIKRAAVLKNRVDAFAVSGYFSPFNPEHEERAHSILKQACRQPVVLGYQLSSRLNSVQRATTASLNASLISTLEEFIGAMRVALDQRGVTAPLMVMRSDGALMSATMASNRPVETVHSGPAASAIGARFLSGQDNALVIDVGGTTTDIAILDGGRVTVREEGTSVGAYRTAVRSANIRSIGLGGDSFIGFNVEDRLRIGPARVTPVSYLAQAYPAVAEDLQRLSHRLHKRPTPDQIEYWFLQREPKLYLSNDRAREVIEMLRSGPLSLPRILERLGLFHPLQFDGQALINAEIVGRAGLTPTDLLHITGEYAPWDSAAAQIAASLVARLRGWTVDDLIRTVKETIAEQIVAEVVSFITGQTLERKLAYTPVNDLGAWLFEENLSQRNPFLGSRLFLKVPIVGIGAPAEIFLPRVAELLGTELVTPRHYGVANAVGAVSGGVMVSLEAWVFPQLRNLHVSGYYAQAGAKRQRFPKLEQALDYARRAIAELVSEQARRAGASEPQIEFEQVPDGAESYRVRARAVGTPSLDGGGAEPPRHKER
ncbi:MAG TPA: hydantoinase/oxoprolinase family protein [Anaerolineales bacterium]